LSENGENDLYKIGISPSLHGKSSSLPEWYDNDRIIPNELNSFYKKNRDFCKNGFVGGVAFSATGGGHLKYYINWLGKCSTPQTPSNRPFLTPKNGVFFDPPIFSIFSRIFSKIIKNSCFTISA
jgi:hypothetical protein